MAFSTSSTWRDGFVGFWFLVVVCLSGAVLLVVEKDNFQRGNGSSMKSFSQSCTTLPIFSSFHALIILTSVKVKQK